MRLSSDKAVILKILRTIASAMLIYLFYSRLEGTFPLFFGAAVLAAASAGGFLSEKTGLKFIPALAGAAAVLFLLRGAVFLVLGILSSNTDIPSADFLFFGFDSGFVPLFLPGLYFFSFWFLVRRRSVFVPVEVAINAVFLALLLWKDAGFSVSLFPHPGLLALYCTVYILVEIFVLFTAFARREDVPVRAREVLPFAVLLIPLLLGVLFFIFGSYTEAASKDGGGLMKPTLFRFDFSDYVKLETEISMGDDLVLLFRN